MSRKGKIVEKKKKADGLPGPESESEDYLPLGTK